MRAVLVLLLLAGCFALAAAWQHHHLARLQRERQAMEAVAAGDLARTESGALEPGAGVLTIGQPSGAEPVRRRERAERSGEDARGGPGTALTTPDGARPGSGIDQGDDAALGDYSLRVQAGQTLSGIAYLHYGKSGSSLVRALADYNGLGDPDRLRSDQELKLPPLERLQGSR